MDGTVDADAQSPPNPRCGDGIIQLSRGEQCDPGVTLAPDATSGACTADCKMACGDAGFVWKGNNHCYTLDPRPAGSLDEVASGYCTQIGAHIVTFASDTELGEVVTNVNPGGPFWVGFDPFVGEANEYTALAQFEPGWSPTCPGCYAQTADATAPLPGSPQGCVEALSEPDASWQQYPCSDAGKIRVICEREPTGTIAERCDGGVCIDVVWTFGQKSYLFVSGSQKASAAGAEAYCQSFGGSLVVLQSRDEREQLWRELGKASVGQPGSFWIGLSNRHGSWIWDDDAGLDAYPSPFGANPSGGNGSQAYLSWTSALPTPVNQTLAHDDVAATTVLDFVCQLPPTDGGF